MAQSSSIQLLIPKCYPISFQPKASGNDIEGSDPNLFIESIVNPSGNPCIIKKFEVLLSSNRLTKVTGKINPNGPEKGALYKQVVEIQDLLKLINNP